MNKDLNRNMHRKSQRKLYKNLSLEYQRLINETAPDLWKRIEAGIEVSGSKEAQTKSDNCLQTEESQPLFDSADSQAEAPAFSKIDSNIMRKTAVAACICLVVAVPLIFMAHDIFMRERKNTESGSHADYAADGAVDYDMADNIVTDNAIANNTITNNQEGFWESDNMQEINGASADSSIISEDAYHTDRSVVAGSNTEQTEQGILDNADPDVFATVVVTATVLDTVAQDDINIYTIQIDALDVPDKLYSGAPDVSNNTDVSDAINIPENSNITKQLTIGSQIQVYSRSDITIKLVIGRQYELKLDIQEVDGNVKYFIKKVE